MRFQPLGPDGTRARMAAIQARLDARLGVKTPPQPPAPTFGGNIDPSTVGLNGEINGNAPMNPFGQAARVSGKGAPTELRTMIQEVAGKYDVDSLLLEALVSQESAFDDDAVSHKGAMGLTQLMPSTAKMLGVTNPRDPLQNLTGGAKYLKQMITEFGGDVEKALAAYNAGPGAVRKYGGIPPYGETQDYVRKILANYEALKRR